MSDKSERDAQRADGDDAMASCMLVDADGNPVFVGDWVKSEKSSDGGDSEGTKSKPQAKSILNASRAMLSATMKSCGANAPGGGGFQSGNTCASEGESASQSTSDKSVSQKVLTWAESKFGDKAKARNFAEWFGDSKVVDDSGEPLTLYHGNRGKSDLDTGWVSFTDNENHAAMFGEVKAYHLAIENPLDISSLGSGGDPDSDEAVSGQDLTDAFAENGIEIDFGGEKRKGFTTELMFKKKDEIKEKLTSAGFDGILVTDYFEYDAPEYIAFREDQIREYTVPEDDTEDDD